MIKYTYDLKVHILNILNLHYQMQTQRETMQTQHKKIYYMLPCTNVCIGNILGKEVVLDESKQLKINSKDIKLHGKW